MWILLTPFFQKLEQKVTDPKMTFNPKSVEVKCVTLPKAKDHCVQVPQKFIKVCGYSDPFFKSLNQRSLTPRWPLIPCLWGQMCDSTQGLLCPSPTKIHQSMWIQWPFFKNLNQRSLTPKWPLIPFLLRSQVWLYLRIIVSKSHGNTSMYVDTVINFAKYHIHTTYIHIQTVYVQNEWSHSLLLNRVQARQKLLGLPKFHCHFWVPWAIYPKMHALFFFRKVLIILR